MSGQPDNAVGRGDLTGGWVRLVVPVVFACSVFGLLVEAAVPHLLPENAVTASVGGVAKAGVFAIWLYLAWRIVKTLQGIYGPDSVHYLDQTPVWRILLRVTAAYALAAFCFAVIYTVIVRRDTDAFSAQLTLGNALYFSIVTMTSTGYGDIFPKSGWAKTAVCVQIMFGVLYNVLFFSIFAGLAGRRREG
ncbi:MULTISPECIES: potassium channel family protein [unclassified Bradyrhizobium]